MQLLDFTQNDYDSLYDFMLPIWESTYGDILPREQILFLVRKYFSHESLVYYREQGYQYKKYLYNILAMKMIWA